MTRAGWIRIGAFLIVLLMGSVAWSVIGTGVARAQASLFGRLIECGAAPPTTIGNATVSLIDAQGANPTLTLMTTPGGLFTFTPPTGTYVVAFAAAGYFNNATPSVLRFDGSRDVRVRPGGNDPCLDKMPARTISFLVHVQAAVGGGSLSGATVQLHDPVRDEIVASGTTNASGNTSLQIWSATLMLRVSRTSFQPNETTVNTATDSPKTVNLASGVFVLGQAFAAGGSPLTAGVVAYLYNIANVPSFQKIITAVVKSDGSYNFTAIPGTYRMIVDADGYTASNTLFEVPASSPPNFTDRVLTPSSPEVVRASFVLGRTNWNDLVVYRNLTLNADSSIPGLKIPFIRSVALQVDFTFGNKNGTVDGGEWAAFETWLTERGTFYVTTDRVYPAPRDENVFDVEGRYYNSTSQSPPTATLSGGRLWINTSATYAVRGTAIPNGRSSYTVNLNMTPDTNGTVYRNQVYVVNLPRRYEMAANTTSPPGTIKTTGFTEVTVDPGLGATPRIAMTVRESRSGVARAMVTGPPGKFYALNGTEANYTAIVSAKGNITFSARQSTDPVGNILDANFTWRFDNASNRNNASWIRYGIDTTFNYTAGGRFTVNLTVVEAGLNVTHRDFTLHVDDTAPVAQVRTNRTSGNANGTTLRLPEDTEVRFDGSFSTDVIFNGSTIPGVIFDGVTTPGSGYAWDFDGDRITDSVEKSPRFTWSKPGEYKVNLTVTDSAGHKSVNATLTAIVNDTMKPTPDFSILDPGDNWVSPPAKLVENKAYFFNASKSTDNYDNASALNYTWTVPGPAKAAPFGNAARMTVIAAKANGTVYGSNISIEWTEFNQSYTVVLNVTDTGFGWNNASRRNSATTNVPVVVQPDSATRPNLEIVTNSQRVTPTSPEEGQAINVTIQVRNQANRGDAKDVRPRLSQMSPAPISVLTTTPQWYDDKWVRLGDPVTIASGKTVHAVFTISFPVQGSKRIEIYVNDTHEPYTIVDGTNRVSIDIAVRQAGWVLPTLVGGSIAVLVAIGLLLRLRTKIRAGEISLRRRKKEKKELEEGGEEAEEEPEEKPREKRRL